MDIIERNKALCEMYKNGATIPQISKQSGISMTQLSRIFRENGVQRKKYELGKDYFELYKDKTIRDISEETGLAIKRVAHLRKIAYGQKTSKGKTDFTDLSSEVDPHLIDDKNWLIQKYVSELNGAPTIARLLACKCSDIYNALKVHGIERRTTQTMMEHKKKYPDKEWLENAYIANKWSIQKCAKEFGCGWDSIYSALRKYGFDIRDASEQHAGEFNEFFGKEHPDDVKQKCAEIGAKAGSEYWSTGDVEAKIALTTEIAKKIWSNPERRAAASKKIAELCQQGKCNPKSAPFYTKGGDIILMRSSWEIAVAEMLDKADTIKEWKYEHIKIPYESGDSIQHFVVDFYVEWIDGLKTLIECKNQYLLSKPDEQLKIQALDEYCKHNGHNYILIQDKNEIKKIALGYVNRVQWITPSRYEVKREYLEDSKLSHEIMFHDIINRVCPWKYPTYTDDELANDLVRLKNENLKGYMSNSGIHSTASNGGGMPGRLIMQHFNQHFWDVEPIGRKSLPLVFNDKKSIYECLTISRDENESLTFERLLREINFHKTKYGRTSHFAPGFARFIIRKFGMSGKKIFDPCCGWGGRLIGAYLEGCKYEGTDLSTKTYNGLVNIAKFIHADSLIWNTSCFDVDWDGDFIFTSPPFYNKEMYIGDNQPWKIYKSRSEWIENFISPFITKIGPKTCVLYLDKETKEDFESIRKFDEIIVIQNKKHARKKSGEEYLCAYNIVTRCGTKIVEEGDHAAIVASHEADVAERMRERAADFEHQQRFAKIAHEVV